MYRSKRALDLILVLGTAPLWIPALLLIAIVVRIKLGQPIFFRQQRAGIHGRPFTLIKFRSMRDGDDRPDADRLTPFGQALRATSLDELPELINVMRGEMSLVGPRPLFMRYGPLYSNRQARRLDVPPGLTGLAQIKGRNALTWEDRFEWDIRYVEHQSLFGDLRILLATLETVLSRRGVSAPGEATMTEFKGSRPSAT